MSCKTTNHQLRKTQANRMIQSGENMKDFFTLTTLYIISYRDMLSVWNLYVYSVFSW